MTPPFASSSVAVLVVMPAAIGAHGVLSGVAATDATAVRTGVADARGVGDGVEAAPQLTRRRTATRHATPRGRLTRW
jgi:hypothetical protein